MTVIQSVQVIQKVYDTGDNPVLVECNDLNSYVCKHNRGQKVATKLFAEIFERLEKLKPKAIKNLKL